MGYLQDVQAGKDGERLVKELFERHGISISKNTSSKRKDLLLWDLRAILPYGEIDLEVKSDLKERQTGNVAVEYFNTKKQAPSGIDATTAKLWVFVLIDPITIWACSVSELQNYIKKVKPLRDVSGGDDNSQMFLYKREQLFDDIFYRIDNASDLSFQIIISKLAHK